ncbi:siderophore-interacting protein [Actinophytocola algeriensis]|uniref:NADPH-dependent ferric siderophore reductase n=1 Tax=Actinophytocola algeriensis TaxID=1768010 RepID=A0A7W7VHR3_9PSEU|nr:siderophore-interacting protein [Actinophytocola algeriensis]MBB4910782.1 NADPH-dependent ferric siderophore reductase [Actinophytocola algeriensis]MBE1473775.1 NADPH-dependent ferric siderophore reductase [Actinophytocola algeriensis]
MPNYSTLERLQMKVLDKAVSLVMAAPAQRAVYDQFTMTVVNTVDLAPYVRRITFRADEFAGHTLTGADEYFGLLMPPAGAAAVTMPSEDRINVRQAIRRMPEDQRPDLRWYTIRKLRAADAEIDVDFILHGDAGPGTRWASRAEPGQVVGFRAGNATYQPAQAGPRLVAADETALPALSAILEAHQDTDIHAFVEVPDDGYRLPIDCDRQVTWLVRGDEAPGSRLLPAIADADTADLGYAWLCGESAIATGLRRHLVRERGVDRRRIMFSGYWKVGAARE